jgi:hypothetical protein
MKSRKAIEVQFRRWIKQEAPSRYIEYITKPYTLDQYKQALEKTFDKDMTWENHGKIWEIDHILPMCYFNFDNENEIKIALDINNLRACKRFINKNKGGSIADAYLLLYTKYSVHPNNDLKILLDRSQTLFSEQYPNIKFCS